MQDINTLKTYCEAFYASHYYPITIFNEENGSIDSFSSFKDFNLIIENEIKEFNFIKYPHILFTKSIGMFAVIKIYHTSYYLIIGPMLEKRMGNDEVSKYAKSLKISNKSLEDFSYLMSTIATCTYNQFINLVCLLELSLNNIKVDPLEIGGFNDTPKEDIKKRESIYKVDSNNKEHGTYYFEKQLLSCIREGDVERLNLLFEQALKNFKYNIGTVGNSQLRQTKNIFLGLVAIVGKTAAIDGGLNVEEAYDLIDMYSVECERCVEVGQVMNLQYNALFDFTKRVHESKKLLNYSKEVSTAIGYIKKNISVIKEIMDVVSYIGVSRTTLLTKFKDEVGVTLGSYINNQKLKEAKLLLEYSDKSILDISLSLGYSSQSYFQNSFKHAFGITPKQYRLNNEHR